MKIVFDHQIFGWQKFGGISRYIFELSSNLASVSAQKVFVVCPLYINSYLSSGPAELNVMGVLTPKIPKIGRILRLINWCIAWPIIRFLQPDIVHETYYSSQRITSKRAKVILTVYDMIHERFVDQFSAFDSTSKDKAVAVARADHIICISEQTRQDLINFLGVNPAKTSVVYLGFSLTSSPSDTTKFNNHNRKFLLYVGTRGGYKNFDSLVKAFSESSSLKENFDLICFGGGAFSGKEISMIQQLNLDLNSVRQVSGSDDLLASFYRAASAFVYPSLYEGFGIPPLEAMSFDCPVVCSNVSSIPEVVGDAGLMFDPYDIQSIKRALESVLSDEVLRNDLMIRGRARIKQFSWERCAQETLQVYKKVSGEH
jgi:glycosyltransferase involved in cell wall biosynthesis